jgi:excinuclease ABC subunit C
MNSIDLPVLSSLPELPGVYQFFDRTGKIIYIGKAKNLKKRVSSYFNRSHFDSAKLRHLVNSICDLKYIVVNTESDALILENILIKKHQPKYNILLRDDKTYPWIVVRNEPFPRVEVTRHYTNDGSIFYGPYTSGKFLTTLMDLVKDLYPLRNCNLNLTESNIKANRFNPCLEYQIGNCLAPCIGNQTSDDYYANIKEIKKILSGNINQLLKFLQNKMLQASKELRFEEANVLKERIRLLSNFQTKSSIILKSIKNSAVFTILQKEDIIAINYLNVSGSVVLQSYNMNVRNYLNEPLDEIFSQAIFEVKSRLNLKLDRILVNILPAFSIPELKITKPRDGEKLNLVKLSLRNAEAYINELKRNEEKKNPNLRYIKYLEQLKKDLNLEKLPEHIECFDNSNLQGTNPVSSCVVFKGGKPAKKEYRHFSIKTVEGPDDFASMREVVKRRYLRLISEDKPLPDLIVIDGGKGQLNAAYQVLVELNINNIPIIGIAKRLEEIFRPGDNVPIYLDKRSMSLKIIQQIRDEAHRFGITYHRKKRDKQLELSVLENIPGIGKKSVQKLYMKFKSLNKIKQASLSELSEVLGKKTAEKIFNQLKNL